VNISAANVVTLCRLYEVDEETTQALVTLAEAKSTRAWWQGYGPASVPNWLHLYLGLEQAADLIRQFEVEVVPGLLQTPGYTAALMQVEGRLPADRQANALAQKAQRQKLLTRGGPPPPQYQVVLSEGVLRRGLAEDIDAWSEQLRHLMAQGVAGRVDLRVLPFPTLHRGVAVGGFTILDFPARVRLAPEPTTVYRESPTGAIYLDEPPQTSVYERIWDDLVARALPAEESLKMISRVNEEIRR
jgi:hypothetical protein